MNVYGFYADGIYEWGFSKNEIIERVHLRFCKLLINFKTSTPSYMVYGELGRYPPRH